MTTYYLFLIGESEGRHARLYRTSNTPKREIIRQMIEKQSIDDVEITLRGGEKVTVTCVMTFNDEEAMNSYHSGFDDALSMFFPEAYSDFYTFTVVGNEEFDKLKN